VPRSKSAKKHERQTKVRQATNRAARSKVRTAVKQARAAGTPEDHVEAFATAERALDRAARKNLMHPNAAARLKRRLARRGKTLST
jgi:small subunit ribosomal protein S20